jgi:hypothetical protein
MVAVPRIVPPGGSTLRHSAASAGAGASPVTSPAAGMAADTTGHRHRPTEPPNQAVPTGGLARDGRRRPSRAVSQIGWSAL